MKQTVAILTSALGMAGCSAARNPAGVSLQEVPFRVAPYVAKVGPAYYLRYQVDTSRVYGHARLMTGSRVDAQKAYYYFIGRVSFPEYKYLLRRPLPPELAPYAAGDAVFWLNPDKSLVKLRVVAETDSLR